ncbi:MAG: isoprenylcysteine carboxylmethyltransferase family protein [Cytophagaceae bacterium]|nr:MAG: isoprenylcysteine carboxylmethyltransferase family protein [Cytophagaceae bacterium]
MTNNAIFGLIFFLAFMLSAFAFPTWRTWKRTGINPFKFGNSDDAHDFAGRAFKVLIALVFAGILLHGFPDTNYMVGSIPVLSSSLIAHAGALLCILSLVWVCVAQWQMGNSWRIGLDHDAPAPLVTAGLFKFSRNPIFLGMAVALAGLVLLIPGVLTMSCFIAGVILMNIQIRLEEAFLKPIHGADYETFTRNVRRWL